MRAVEGGEGMGGGWECVGWRLFPPVPVVAPLFSLGVPQRCLGRVRLRFCPRRPMHAAVGELPHCLGVCRIISYGKHNNGVS